MADLELENIARDRDEPIEEYVRRYEKTRIKQLNEGMQQFSWRRHSLALLRDSGLPEFHLHQMMYDRNNIIPNTEPLYQQLMSEILRRSRLIEGTYGNPMVWIRRNPRRYHDNFRGYYGNEDHDPDDHTDSYRQEHAYLAIGSGKGSSSWKIGYGTSYSQ